MDLLFLLLLPPWFFICTLVGQQFTLHLLGTDRIDTWWGFPAFLTGTATIIGVFVTGALLIIAAAAGCLS
ncbi:MAG: hypothetical protein ACOVT5_17745 [Armatimonadaceae bacterium]